jgi:hypothetical protein
LPKSAADAITATMRWAFLVAAMLLCPAGAFARPPAPLSDPTALNIGLNCQWQQRCIGNQQRAMKRALKYVKKYQPPVWRVQLCNHNAARTRYRVDWIGYDNCIRNSVLRPLPARAIKAPPRAAKKRVRRITESSPSRPSLGERG